MSSARPGSRNRASKWRGPHDFYPTPPEAVTPFLDAHGYDGANYMIWEPACGDGAISKILAARGYDVVSTDIRPRGIGEVHDFLRDPPIYGAPNHPIVTNPPFHLADAFVRCALAINPPEFAFLLRTKYLEGAKRYETIFAERPPAVIYQFIERIKFYSGDAPRDAQPGWNTEAFAWFVWERGFQGDPVVKWIHRGKA